MYTCIMHKRNDYLSIHNKNVDIILGLNVLIEFYSPKQY